MTTCYELGFSFSPSPSSSSTTNWKFNLGLLFLEFSLGQFFSFSLLSSFEWIYLRTYTLFTLPRIVLHSTVSSYRQIAHATNLFFQSHLSHVLFMVVLAFPWNLLRNQQASERASFSFCFGLFLGFVSAFAILMSHLLVICLSYLLFISYLFNICRLNDGKAGRVFHPVMCILLAGIL
jgi:hypothetical protein